MPDAPWTDTEQAALRLMSTGSYDVYELATVLGVSPAEAARARLKVLDTVGDPSPQARELTAAIERLGQIRV